MGNFKSETVPVKHDISVVYNPSQGEQIIEVLHNNPTLIRQIYGLESVKGCANAILMELRCCASINSLAAVPLPDITGDDSESGRVVKTHTFEWLTSRFELVVFRKAPGQQEWAECGVTALKNSAGHRYRLHRLLDLTTDNIGCDIGEWGRLGVAIQNVGYELPTIVDRIAITGSWTQEFTWVEEHPTYVVVNNYGSTSTPTPTPTPTPAPTPTFALSLAQGKTSAVASSNDSIILTITNIAAGKGISGVWLNGTATTATEVISATSTNVHTLSSSKLAEFGAGNYSLKLTYEGVEYTTNAVAVTLAPQVTLNISATQSGDLSFFVVDGQTYEFSIQGSFFVPGPATFTWFRGDNPATVSPSPGVNNAITGSLTVGSNGTFTLNKATSSATFTSYYDSTNKEGSYRIRISQDGIDTFSNTIYGANKVSSIGFSPTSVSQAATSNVIVTIGGFAVGQALTTVWTRNGIELAGTTQQHTYTENGGNSFNGFWYQFTIPASSFASSPYGGTGTYRLKVTRTNTPVNFTSTSTLTVTA